MLNEIKWRPLNRALLAVSPFIGMYILSNNTHWLTTSALICICTTITEEKLALTYLGVLMHGTAIMLGFMILSTVSVWPPLFVIFCAMMAMFTVWVMSRGHLLRSLGNFTFIPALYLTCEISENTGGQLPVIRALHELPFMAAGMSSVFLLSLWHQTGLEQSHAKAKSKPKRFLNVQFSYRTDYGQSLGGMEACFAIASAVGLATALVEWQNIEHGQWVIWSAASIVTGEAGTEHRKFLYRGAGALIGVPPGIMTGWVLPHSSITNGVSILAGLLTLIAFRRYIVGFSARCFFIALAITVSNHSALIAGERIFNVLLGGVTGIASVFLLRRLYRKFNDSNPD